MQRGQLQQMVNERTSSRRPARTSLPPLEELVGRISEAQMSAKLLHQVLGSTPRNEILENELVKVWISVASQRSEVKYFSKRQAGVRPPLPISVYINGRLHHLRLSPAGPRYPPDPDRNQRHHPHCSRKIRCH